MITPKQHLTTFLPVRGIMSRAKLAALTAVGFLMILLILPGGYFTRDCNPPTHVHIPRVLAGWPLRDLRIGETVMANTGRTHPHWLRDDMTPNRIAIVNEITSDGMYKLQFHDGQISSKLFKRKELMPPPPPLCKNCIKGRNTPDFNKNGRMCQTCKPYFQNHDIVTKKPSTCKRKGNSPPSTDCENKNDLNTAHEEKVQVPLKEFRGVHIYYQGDTKQWINNTKGKTGMKKVWHPLFPKEYKMWFGIDSDNKKALCIKWEDDRAGKCYNKIKTTRPEKFISIITEVKDETEEKCFVVTPIAGQKLALRFDKSETSQEFCAKFDECCKILGPVMEEEKSSGATVPIQTECCERDPKSGNMSYYKVDDNGDRIPDSTTCERPTATVLPPGWEARISRKAKSGEMIYYKVDDKGQGITGSYTWKKPTARQDRKQQLIQDIETSEVLIPCDYPGCKFGKLEVLRRKLKIQHTQFNEQQTKQIEAAVEMRIQNLPKEGCIKCNTEGEISVKRGSDDYKRFLEKNCPKDPTVCKPKSEPSFGSAEGVVGREDKAEQLSLKSREHKMIVAALNHSSSEHRSLAEEITDPVVFCSGFIIMLLFLAAIYLMDRRADRRKRDALLRGRREATLY